MAIEFSKKTARFVDVAGVEEAERLLGWLQSNPKGKVDLSGCSHLHAANLQVLMAARPAIAAWPGDASLAAWLRSALDSNK